MENIGNQHAYEIKGVPNPDFELGHGICKLSELGCMNLPCLPVSDSRITYLDEWQSVRRVLLGLPGVAEAKFSIACSYKDHRNSRYKDRFDFDLESEELHLSPPREI